MVLAVAIAAPPPGGPALSGEIRQLIRRMKAENPTWGAPRIHGELERMPHPRPGGSGYYMSA